MKLVEKIIYRGTTARSFSKNAEAYAGIFFGPTAKKVSGWGTPIKYTLSNKAKIFEYDSSDAYCYALGLYDKEYKELNLICEPYGIDVRSLNYFTLLERGEPRKELDKKVLQVAGSLFCWYDLWTWCTQLVARIELEKRGYDGAKWEQEDWGNFVQYLIWNLDVVKAVEEENLQNKGMKFKFKLVEDKSLLQLNEGYPSMVDLGTYICAELNVFGGDLNFMQNLKNIVMEENNQMRKLTIRELKENLGEKQFNKVVELVKEFKTINEGFELTLKSSNKKSLKEAKVGESAKDLDKPTNYVSNKVYKNTLIEVIDMNGAELVSEAYIVYSAYVGGWKPIYSTIDFADAKRAYTKATRDKYAQISVLVKFNNLTENQAKEVYILHMGVYVLDKFLASCGVDFEILEDTSTVPVSTATKKASKAKVGYKYYYIVCMCEEAFKPAEVLAAGTIKVDLSKLSSSETPEELAMTDYFDGTGIAYSDDWDDAMWDDLTRYVYEIDEDVYKTGAGLPKTDSEIIKYVEDSVADYKE